MLMGRIRQLTASLSHSTMSVLLQSNCSLLLAWMSGQYREG